MDVSLFALSGIFIAVSSGIMVFVMFVFGQNRLHRLWGVFSLSVFAWGLGGFFIGTADDPARADFWWRVTHVGIAFIPVLFLHFVYEFLHIKKPSTLVSFYVLAGFFSFLAVFSDALIANMRFVFNEFYYDSPPGMLYPFFTAYFFGSVIYSHYLLYRGYSRIKGSEEHQKLQQARIWYFFIAMFASFSGGSLSFLPVYGLDVYPITNFTVTVYPIIVGYAILRLRLFDIRIVAAQGLVLLLWLFFGIRLAVSFGSRGFFLDSVFFIAIVALGIFLVRSVTKEVESRREVERLAKKLKDANARLKVLDQRKSEFLSLASHQLRSPLTAIKGYASMLVEGSYGEFPTSAREPLRRVFESSDRLVKVIEDFLTISRIEQNRLSYEFKTTDVKKIVADIVTEMRPTAEKKGLSLTADIEKGASFFVTADAGKIRQVIGNLVDNAIKYTPKGSVNIALVREPAEHLVRLSVRDTGVGLTPAAKKKLFQKFSRAEGASKTNAGGTGLGLYVAKQIVGAHRGRIWAESKGKGKGAAFYVELPTQI